MTNRIALIGYGKIAREQHLPAIEDNARLRLCAIATPGVDPELGVPCFASVDELLKAMTDRIDSVAICTPPSPRFDIARQALEAGLDVLLEKPPTATLGELQELGRIARSQGRAIYAGWHSQHAPGVARAAEVLAGKVVVRLIIRWHEDVCKWHPGQEWIWQPGNFGVFDPGINALSIATRILEYPLLVSEATLFTPQNKQVPIAASVRFIGDAVCAEFDWRPTDNEQWTICLQTSDGIGVELRHGGSQLFIDDVEQELSGLSSYASIYARFAELCASQTVDIDYEPLRIVADIFLKAKIVHVESFQ